MAERPSPYSAEGTLLHDHDAHPEKDRSKLQPAQRRALVKNEELRNQMLANAKQLMGIPEGEECIIRRENITVALSDEEGNPMDIPGHPDFMVYWKRLRCLFVADSKFGRIFVPPADSNTQIQHYIVGAAENWPVNQAVGCITQPWASGDNNVTWVHYQNPEQIADVKAELLGIVRATEDPNAAFNGSAEACLYCKAAGLCRTGAEIITEMALKQANLMSVEEIERLFPSVVRSEKMAEAIRTRMIEFGKKDLLKNYMLKEGAECREITDPFMAFEFLATDLGMNRDLAMMVFLRCCSVSVPKLQAEIAAAKSMDDKAAAQYLNDTLGEYLQRSQKRPSIAQNTNVNLQFE